MRPQRVVFALFLAVSLLLSHVPARAQLAPPSIYVAGDGVFFIAFTTPNVFDLSSDWVAHGSNGKLSGTLRTTDHAEIDLLHEISGSCKMSRGVTTVKQRIKIFGFVGGDDLYKSVSDFEGTIVGYGAQAKLVGNTETRVCIRFDYGPFSKKKVTVCDTEKQTNQSWNHDGRWSITLAFQTVGKKITGSAVVSVAESSPEKKKSYETTVEGKLDPDGEANFKLKPVDGDNGIGGALTLRALVIPGNAVTPPQLLEILEVGGKILGQKFAEGY